MKKNKKIKRVVYIVENTDSAQFRYRVKNVKDALDNSGKWNVEYFSKADLSKMILDDVKLVIIVRQTAKDRKVLNVIDRAKEKGIKILFDIDDLVFDYRDLRVLMESVHERSVVYWLGYIWGIRRIAKRVDGFICTNSFLAGKLKRSFGKPVRVIRNSLCKEQVELAKELVVGKKANKRSFFTIGYFSGSSTHARDFRVAEPGLIDFLNKHDDAKLTVVGCMSFSNRMRKMIDAERVEISGLVDYLKLQELISRVDVNIAPLVVNDFTNCKSELKFFEAAVVETTSIASPTHAFSQAIEEGKNGLIAQSDEWYNKLEYLFNHPDENRKMALEAKSYVLEHYYGMEFLREVEGAYEYFAK